jgi:hypothetical protein
LRIVANERSISWPADGKRIFKGDYRSIYERIQFEEHYMFGVGYSSFGPEDSSPGLLEEEVRSTEDAEDAAPIAEPSDNIAYFQFAYESNDNQLQRARLACFPSPEKHSSFVRIDFNRDDVTTDAHSECHLQVHALESIRIPFSKLPPPSAFVDFCLCHFFRDEWTKLHARLGRHEITLEELFTPAADLCGIHLQFKRRPAT